MKIIFLCSSLEAGKDGVGDYCRKMAAGLAAMGHQTLIIALNDKFLNIDECSEYQPDENQEILVYRYSRTFPWKHKIFQIQKIISGFQPDWLSFQYVAYGFDKKGLPFYLPKVFRNISSGQKWHVMFHETWIGMSYTTPFIHKIYGYFQKKIAVSLIKLLSPKIITTTNVLYQLALKEEDIYATCLPLFSNIAKHEKDDGYLSFIEEKYSMNLRDEAFYKLGVFGTLYPEANLYSVIPEFLKKENLAKQIIIIVFGRNNRPDEVLKLKKHLNNSVIFIELGQLSEQKVSSIMGILNRAVLCTPIEYIGKSGAYAALRLHNVDVEVLSSAPILKYKKEISDFNNYLMQRKTNEWSVANVANKFIFLLESV